MSRSRIVFPLIVLLLLLLAAGAFAQAPAFDPSRYGFMAPAASTTLSLGRADAQAARPAIVYVLDPAQASARATLSSLEKLRLELGDRVHIAAIASVDRAALSSVIKGLAIGYPLIASVSGIDSMVSKTAPVSLILAPDGKILGVRKAFVDWASASAMKLAKDLAASYPQAATVANPEVPDFLSAVEADVVTELNLARGAPKEYAAYLREYRSHIRGNRYEVTGETTVILNEGAKAVDEAIAFLERQKPLGALAASRGLSRAARDLARDQASGGTGHTASDGSSPFDRMGRYGEWKFIAGENCAYGGETGRDIVIQLIVDDGVASRGHRANIFNVEYKTVGVAVGPHSGYRIVCVQDFAGGFSEKN